MLARQLDKHTMGYLTYKGGLHSFMNTTVVRETEKKLNAVYHSGNDLEK